MFLNDLSNNTPHFRIDENKILIPICRGGTLKKIFFKFLCYHAVGVINTHAIIINTHAKLLFYSNALQSLS